MEKEVSTIQIPAPVPFPPHGHPGARDVRRRVAHGRRIRELPRRRRRRALAPGAVEVLGELLVVLKGPLAEDAHEVVAPDDLLAQQLLGHEADLPLLRREQVAALLVGLVDDAADLAVDVLGRGFGEGLVQLLLLVVLVEEVADLGGHAPPGHHGRGRAGDLVEVVAGARGHGVEVQLLADAAGERHGHAVHELVDVHQVGVALGEILRVAEGALAARDDGDFEERVGVFEEPAADGVAGFVIGDCAFFLGIQDEGFLFETANDALNGLFEVDHCYFVGACAGSWRRHMSPGCLSEEGGGERTYR